MILMRWRWRREGQHVHVRVFTAQQTEWNQEPARDTFAFCGRLIFAADEWLDVLALLGPRIDVLEDSPE
jgi:hypothetical protein